MKKLTLALTLGSPVGCGAGQGHPNRRKKTNHALGRIVSFAGKHGQCGRMKDLTSRARPPPRALGRWPCRELGRCWPRAARFCFALASQHLLGGIQGIFDQDAQPVAPLLQRLRELRQDVFPVRLGVQGGYIPDIPIAGFRAFKYVSSMAVVKVTFAYSARADYHHPRSSARPQGRSRPVAPSPAPLASGQRA